MIKNRSGFTLVEIAIAILVLSIGVLAIFALIAAGLNANNKAIADTQSAMFADTVFNGLRAKSIVCAQNQDQTKGTIMDKRGGQLHLGDDDICPWETFWWRMYNKQTNITIAAGDTYLKLAGQPQPIKCTGQLTDAAETIVYKNASARGVGDGTAGTGVENYALQYKLIIDARFTDRDDDPNWETWWSNTALVTLYVWEGEFTDTENMTNAAHFYCEFSNPGDL